MKTNSYNTAGRFSLPTFGLLLLLLAACPHRAAAQTNTFPSSGSAGVGTTNPSGTKLHVVHNTGGEATVLAEAGSSMSPAMEFKDAAATPNRWRIGSGFTTTTDGLFFIYDKRQSAARMIIDTSGNVGIGTASPLQRLQLGSNTITGSAAPDAISLGATYSTTAGANPKIRLFDNGASAVYGVGISDSQFDFMIPTGSRYAWNINGAEKMRLDTSGNLGIGTTTPSGKLHVVSGTDNGTALLNLDTGVHGGTSMLVYGTANNESGYDMSVYRAGQYFSRFGVTNYGHVYFQPGGGSVGIGTSTPNYRLDIQGGQINSSGGLCIAGDCKTAWSQVGGAGSSQWTTSGANIYYNSGNVGIGTTSPTSPLVIQGNEPSNDYATLRVKPTVTHGGLVIDSANNSSQVHLRFYKNGVPKWQFRVPFQEGTEDLRLYSWGASADVMSISPSGSVGIGTITPSATLHVQGTGRFTQSLTVDGNINAKYQDVAEWVPASHALPAGTVVTLDPTKSNHVEASSHAYDTRVAGVVSAQPGITLGEQSDSKVLVATTGRVKVMVDASSGPIQVGDLLVTSDIVGVAKKSEPLLLGGVPIHRPGTLIGKALEPLAKGRAEILVLLSLQ